jgi:hypothetical protein
MLFYSLVVREVVLREIVFFDWEGCFLRSTVFDISLTYALGRVLILHS